MRTAGVIRVVVAALAASVCGAACDEGGVSSGGAADAGPVIAPGRADAGVTPGTGDAAAPAPAPLPGQPGKFVERPCSFSPAPARPVKCGVVVVPETRGGSSTRMVELAVAIIKSSSPTPAPDPLLFLQGGPGGGGVDFIVALAGGMGGPLDPVLAKRDVLSIDQRGTGRSLPLLDCPEVNQVAMGMMPPPAMMMMNGIAAALGRCRARLAATGIDLNEYQTNAAADDVEDVRLALGYQQWNVLGGSYGTRLALELLRRHPAGLRTVLLDSVSPPDADLIGESGGNGVKVLDAAWAICATQPACAQAYPDLPRVFVQTVGALNAQPARLLGGLFPLDGDTYLQLVQFMLRSPALLPDLPEVVFQARDKRYTLLQQLLLQLVQAMGGGGAGGGISMGLHLSVMCADYLPFTSKAMIEARAADVAAELRAAVMRPGLGYLENCAVWNVRPSPAAVAQPVQSPINALVLAGTMDPATPPRWAQQAARTLPAGHYVEIKGVSHGVFPTPCGSQLLAPFLDTPGSKPAPACLGAAMDVQFKVQR